MGIERYKFQFNNDTESCKALISCIKDGWTIKGFLIEDGYTWFLLERF